MNLIEQLGGYEKSKRELKLKEEGSMFQCCISVSAEMIRDALLQYRRENNIFEEHDWVVIPSRGNGLFSVSRLLCRSDRDEMRHATPKEIVQGYRDD